MAIGASIIDLGNGGYRCEQQFSGGVLPAGVFMGTSVALNDGIYILEYEIEDLAGHVLNSENAAAHSTDPENFSNYIIIIDSESPEISVTQPYEGFYTNQSTVPVSGYR